jgi:hypothetical protein
LRWTLEKDILKFYERISDAPPGDLGILRFSLKRS